MIKASQIEIHVYTLKHRKGETRAHLRMICACAPQMNCACTSSPVSCPGPTRPSIAAATEDQRLARATQFAAGESIKIDVPNSELHETEC